MRVSNIKHKTLTITFSFIASSFLVASLASCESSSNSEVIETESSEEQDHVHEYGAYIDTNDGVSHQRECTICGYIDKGMHEVVDDNGDCIYCEASSLFTGGDSISYMELDEGYSVSSFDTQCQEEALFIPSTHNGKPVTEIGDFAFKGSDTRNDYLKYLSLPTGIRTIGMYAFSFCASLTSVTLPRGLTSIGESAFEYCSLLTDISLPSSLVSLGESAFSCCASLISITIPSGIPSLGVWTFYRCSSLTSILIDKSLVYIDDYAFYYCEALTSIYYMGSPSEFNSIFYDINTNDCFDEASKYYYDKDGSKPYDNNDISYQYWHYDKNGNIIIWD